MVSGLLTRQKRPSKNPVNYADRRSRRATLGGERSVAKARGERKRSRTMPSIDREIARIGGSRTRVEAGANGEGEGPAAEHVRGGRDGELLRGDVAFRRDSELWGGRRGIRGSANRKKTSSRGGPRERARRAPIARAARLGRRNGGDVGNSHEKKRRGGFFSTRHGPDYDTAPRRAIAFTRGDVRCRWRGPSCRAS